MIEPSALTFVGMDVHRDSIAVALLRPDEHVPLEQTIANTPEALRKQLRRWGDPQTLRVCYEAGPTGYALQRQLAALGIDCAVIAPSLIPTRPGRRVKTDKRDARALCRLFRAGELTRVRVPGPDEEIVRDVVRAREDLTEDIVRSRHRISKLLLRHGRVYRERRSTWTEAHLAWIRRQRFESERLERLVAHQLAVLEARLAQRDPLDEEIAHVAQSPAYAAAVRRLSCLRGIAELSAITLLVEVGDFARFPTAPQFHGLHRAHRQRALQRRGPPPGCDHQERQRPPAAHPGRGRLESAAPAGLRSDVPPPRGRAAAGGAPLRHGRAAAAAPALLAHRAAPAADPDRRGRRRARARRLRLGTHDRAHRWLGRDDEEASAAGSTRASLTEGSSTELCGRP